MSIPVANDDAARGGALLLPHFPSLPDFATHPEPLRDIVADLAEAPALPRLALRAAVAYWEEVLPILLRLVEATAHVAEPDELEANVIFHAVHLFAAQSEPRALAIARATAPPSGSRSRHPVSMTGSTMLSCRP
ncbi:MAG: hypothetical protein FJX52_11340 [Alphaproteobacteria bacterium]|nr:hypothetical protein [Alphaproteobacteria bacterium]